MSSFPDLRRMARRYYYEETKMVRDIAAVMSKNTGPFTKKMLIELLSDTYPEKSYQELKNEIGAAIMIDKECNRRFKVVRTGVWELRVDRDQELPDIV